MGVLTESVAGYYEYLRDKGLSDNQAMMKMQADGFRQSLEQSEIECSLCRTIHRSRTEALNCCTDIF